MNSFFHFKKFTIQQAACAMKVTEIACILGAWSHIPAHSCRVLDIGCGTGLLALMLAQKNPQIKIDAIELEEKCYLQAVYNIQHSIFSEQIQCIHGEIQKFVPSVLYDFVIANPPFFEKSLAAHAINKKMAWHSSELTLEELIKNIDRLLHPAGNFGIIIPVFRKRELEKICESHSFYPSALLEIRHSESHPVSHVALRFSRTNHHLQTEILTLRNGKSYTPEFITLMRDYYLKL